MKKLAKMIIFRHFWPPIHPTPTGNGYLMAIEARNMYKMPFKSDNPLPDMILSQKTTTYWQKMYKITIFHCFWPTLHHGNWSLMARESWSVYKTPFKSDNPSLDLICSQWNHKNHGQKIKKMAIMTHFYFFFYLRYPLEFRLKWPQNLRKCN